ncbi:hypothetical protein D9758_011533 [Tetrapyrgos nigripes]|uniref:Peptide N-acetyl-beta-D-glucosaminyl asparaginase amidase A N-terminal domain-containing protein n=1 Tax=Tetrapyrgos nigripes TaxID=182062 RepID=A0A8H5FRC7_9AGAR|nr:hypothetical protein D9758_011533 [Tetrapyrgos nigripes]
MILQLVWTGLLPALFSLSRAAVLVDFQVAQPPPVPQDAKQCTIQVFERVFAFSFGDAEVVNYTPPTDCGEPGSWAAVTLNFTVTSNGTQFDRLGILTFQNVEIWRTSTPEPTRGDGIIWEYIKDVTRFTPLFAEPGTFIMQLDNLIQTGLDGNYSSMLSCTQRSMNHPRAPYSRASELTDTSFCPDAIIPLSTLANDTGNDAQFLLRSRSTLRYLKTQSSCTQSCLPRVNGQEEFWYFNVPNDNIDDLPPGFALGGGPFREVRLLIDGQVAGVAFPYATIFTGGIVPTAWRPITSYGALDLPTYFLDLTPFIPALVDGEAHEYTIDVISAEQDHTILQNWFVSGLLQVVTDPSGAPTTGNITSLSADPFPVTTSTAQTRRNGSDVIINVSATRTIHVELTS